MSGMMTTCGTCGKRIVVTWPQLYYYRRGDVFLCGEDCMIVYDTKKARAVNGYGKKKEGAEEDMAGKLTLKQKEEVVEIAIKGGDPIEYLKKCGIRNPYASWDWIKQKLPEKNPAKYDELTKAWLGRHPDEAWAKLPAENGRDGQEAKKEPAEVEKVDRVPPVAAEPLQLQGGVNYQLQVDEMKAAGNRGLPDGEYFVIGKQFRVTGLKTDFGRFELGRISDKVIYFRAKDDFEISLTIEDWRKMAESLPEILMLLTGVRT